MGYCSLKKTFKYHYMIAVSITSEQLFLKNILFFKYTDFSQRVENNNHTSSFSSLVLCRVFHQKTKGALYEDDKYHSFHRNREG